jgi:hypothetical protein
MAYDPFMSVFNCHVNDAKRKANTRFIAKFGRQQFSKVMMPLFRKGIMSIFHDKPTKLTQWWVDEVTRIVNAQEADHGQRLVDEQRQRT